MAYFVVLFFGKERLQFLFVDNEEHEPDGLPIVFCIFCTLLQECAKRNCDSVSVLIHAAIEEFQTDCWLDGEK